MKTIVSVTSKSGARRHPDDAMQGPRPSYSAGAACSFRSRRGPLVWSRVLSRRACPSSVKPLRPGGFQSRDRLDLKQPLPSTAFQRSSPWRGFISLQHRPRTSGIGHDWLRSVRKRIDLDQMTTPRPAGASIDDVAQACFSALRLKAFGHACSQVFRELAAEEPAAGDAGQVPAPSVAAAGRVNRCGIMAGV